MMVQFTIYILFNLFTFFVFFFYFYIFVIFVFLFCFFFFFSSRRRHTRCGRDWSSDVCSSDLIKHNILLWCFFSKLINSVNLFEVKKCLAKKITHWSYPSLITKACFLCVRSEEHTSELQSRPHLVCRLLLEKKNKVI